MVHSVGLFQVQSGQEVVSRQDGQVWPVVGHSQVVLLPASQREDLSLREPFHFVCPGLGRQAFQSSLADARLGVLQQTQPGRLPVLLCWQAVGRHGLFARPSRPRRYGREVGELPCPGEERVHVTVHTLQLGSRVRGRWVP
jgi:hypothetical protein